MLAEAPFHSIIPILANANACKAVIALILILTMFGHLIQLVDVNVNHNLSALTPASIGIKTHAHANANR